MMFRTYCWLHGTAYIHPHLQGKTTGCYVDQSKLKSPEVSLPIYLSINLSTMKTTACYVDQSKLKSPEVSLSIYLSI